MAVPKRKTTRAKRDQRRANHDRVSAPNTIPCPNCGDMMLPHRVCPNCGHYKGREIVATAEPETPAVAPDSDAS
ncbi:MAG: 50S ribosomal protein L32 [Myxococcales bacterium]